MRTNLARDPGFESGVLVHESRVTNASIVDGSRLVSGDAAKASDKIWREALLALNPMLEGVPDGATASMLEITENYPDGTLNGAATVVKEELAPRDVGVLNLPGASADYARFAAPTRRNLATNPRAAVDLTGISSLNSPTALARVTGISGPLDGITTGVQLDMDSNGDAVQWTFAATSGVTYTISIYAKGLAFTGAGRCRLFAYNNAFGLLGAAAQISAAGDWTRYSVTFTAAATETHRLVFGSDQIGAGTASMYLTAAMIEASGTLGAYFDGDGYVNAAGAWATSDGWSGWLGTAHASASDFGPFANGVVRTWVGRFTVQTAAATTIGQILFGSEIAVGAPGGTGLYLYNNAGTRMVFATVNNTFTSWTLTADEANATLAGKQFDVRWEFNEPANTMVLQINDLPAVQKTGVTVQQAAGQTQVRLGVSNTTYPFPGKVAAFAVYGRALTAAEWATLRKASKWDSYGPTINGAWSLKLASAANMGLSSVGSTEVQYGWRFAAKEGEAFSASVISAFVSSTGVHARLAMVFLTSALAEIGARVYGSGTAGRTDPQILSILNQVAPTNAGFVFVMLQLVVAGGTNPIGSVVFDDLLVVKGEALHRFLDAEERGARSQGARFYSPAEEYPQDGEVFTDHKTMVPRYMWSDPVEIEL
jgi:hypothetical protein